MEYYFVIAITVLALVVGIFLGMIVKKYGKKESTVSQEQAINNIGYENTEHDAMKSDNPFCYKTELEQELLRIVPLGNDEIIDKKAVEVPMGQLTNILSVVPNALASKALSGAYKIIMPPNATGPLIQRTSGPMKGLYDTTTKAAGGGFGPHAGLQSLNPAAVALGVFTVLSLVTSQYFLAEINKKLADIEQEIKKLQKMFENKIKAEINASIYFILDVLNSLNQITQTERQTIASLTNVQSRTILLLENSFYYEEEIESTLDSIKTQKKFADMEKEYDILIEKIGFWLLCIYGFFYGKIAEIILSQNFDENYLKQEQDKLHERAELYKNNIQKFLDSGAKFLKDGKFPFWKKLDAFQIIFNRYSQIHKDREKLENKQEALFSIVQTISKLNTNNGMQITVKNDKAYLVQGSS